ncbi:MAG: phage head closure protein [Proteobacteria bacterium]|nr:phage head closure protein [Pseudomonadota bacterium]
MRAGRLDRVITIQQYTETVNDLGTPSFAWASLTVMRAQIIQTNTEEFIRAFGASDETVIIFRTRFHDGVALADRVVFDGDIFNIKDIKEVGRRRGLEIRCVRAS